MTTAVDSNVLLDFMNHDPEFGLQARDALRACAAEGRLVACDAVCAEIAGTFLSHAVLRQALDEMHIEFSPLTLEASLEAGIAWRTYRAQGGSRSRVIVDFLIGAHALRQADRLLTRDRGFYRTYFRSLRIFDPTRH